jgi:hypothetical protein
VEQVPDPELFNQRLPVRRVRVVAIRVIIGIKQAFEDFKDDSPTYTTKLHGCISRRCLELVLGEWAAAQPEGEIQ